MSGIGSNFRHFLLGDVERVKNLPVVAPARIMGNHSSPPAPVFLRLDVDSGPNRRCSFE